MQGAKLRRGDALRDGLVAHAESVACHPAEDRRGLGEVHAHILPEVGELQRGAGGVGKPELRSSVRFAAGIEHQPANGIGRVAAVRQHIVHGGVAGDGLVLAKAVSRSANGSLGMRAGADGFGQRDKDRMARAALIAGIEFPAPQIEQGQGLRRSPTSSPRSSETRQ